MSNTKQNSKQHVKSSETRGLKVKTNVKAGPDPGGGGWLGNHGVRVRTGVKAGGLRLNHGVRVRHSSR